MCSLPTSSSRYTWYLLLSFFCRQLIFRVLLGKSSRRPL